jgi:HAD superfamily hydrolase (TIGR01509 family)
LNPGPRPKVLLLDLGNVTVRLRFGDFFERLGAACVPARTAEELRGMLQDPGSGHAGYERGFFDGPGWHVLLQQRLGLALDYAAWLGLWNDVFEPNPPMESLIKGLRGQVRVWGLSNTNPEHLRHLRAAYPVLGAFEGITASCEVGAAKPEAAIYGAALRSLGVPGAEVLYLDDIQDYVRAAEPLGIRGFHYTFNDAALHRTLRSLGLSVPPLDMRPGDN